MYVAVCTCLCAVAKCLLFYVHRGRYFWTDTLCCIAVL